MSTAKNVIVKFRKGWRGYNAGETAGFEEEVARVLVDGEVAEYADGKARAKPKREKPEKQGAGQGDAGAAEQTGTGSIPPAGGDDDERP